MKNNIYFVGGSVTFGSGVDQSKTFSGVLNKEFKAETKEMESKNQNLNIWRWQHFTFEKNILYSMKIAKKALYKLENEYHDQFKDFELKII